MKLWASERCYKFRRDFQYVKNEGTPDVFKI
jgi:hypothetical protein